MTGFRPILRSMNQGSPALGALDLNAYEGHCRSAGAWSISEDRFRAHGLGRGIPEVVPEEWCRPARGTSVMDTERSVSAVGPRDERPHVQHLRQRERDRVRPSRSNA